MKTEKWFCMNSWYGLATVNIWANGTVEFINRYRVDRPEFVKYFINYSVAVSSLVDEGWRKLDD